MIARFEEIIAWQKAKLLCRDCYKAIQHIKDFSFRDQIQRATVSVMNNIAEGFERSGSVELRRFLLIAKGSNGEVRSMLYLARELEYIPNDECERLLSSSEEVSRIISGLIKTCSRPK